MKSPGSARLAAAASCLLIVSGAAVLAALDDARGDLSLVFLRPVVESLLPIGRSLVRSAHTVVSGSGTGLGFVLLLGALVTPGPARRFLLACGLAVLGQIALLVGPSLAGTVLYAMAALSLIGAPPRAPDLVRGAAERLPPAPWTGIDVLVLSGLTLVAAFLRFYALNEVFDYFEGELSPYSAGATSLRGMSYANVGHLGPWAPLGYLYYLPLYVTTQLFGTTVLAIRIASAIPSVLTVVFLYGLVRRISGRGAAATAAFLVALDPLQIGWGRSDIHPHGSTVQVAILLCWATAAAAESGRWRDFLLVALLMGVSMHQYPSGQVAVLIPPAFFVWRWACGAPLRRGRAAFSSLAGLVLWAFGFPLQYILAYGRWEVPNLLTIFGARTSWAEAGGEDRLTVLGEVLARSAANFSDLAEGIFVRVPLLFHQSFIPDYPGLSVRSVVWLAAPFAVVLALRVVLRRRADGVALLLVWALVGFLPSVLSAQGYPKRAAIAYPAILALGGIGLAAALRALVDRFGDVTRGLLLSIGAVAGAAYLVASTFLWFSGERYPYGKPREADVARAVGELLEPGTIVVGDFWEHYNHGKFMYLLLGPLRRPDVKPVAWFAYRSGWVSMETILEDPASIVGQLRRAIEYRWTPLWDDLPAIERRTAWSSLVWIAQSEAWDDRADPIRERLATLRRWCPSAEVIAFDDHRVDRRFEVLRCFLRDLRSPGERPADEASGEPERPSGRVGFNPGSSPGHEASRESPRR